MQKEELPKNRSEDILSRFYQVRPVVLHLEVRLLEKPITPNNIGEEKKLYLCNMKRTKMSSLFWIPYQSNFHLKGKMSSVHSFILVLRKATILMHGILLHTTVKIGVITLKVFILISPTVQWHMLITSE